MRVRLLDKPRSFSPLQGIELRDMGEISLAVDEQITFTTGSGKRNDVLCKEWGFYLSNSLDTNLRKQGFKAALVRSYASTPPRLYLNLVEIEKMAAFTEYIKKYNAEVICWLDEWFENSTATTKFASKN